VCSKKNLYFQRTLLCVRHCACDLPTMHNIKPSTRAKEQRSPLDWASYERRTAQCCTHRGFVSKRKQEIMIKKSSLIDAEPNRYVDGRRRGRSWGDSKTHIGFRTHANSVASLLRPWCSLGPWWHAWDVSRSRLNYSVVLSDSPPPRLIFIVCISLFVCTRRDSQLRHTEV
jgi:hypothetical protein